MSYGSSFGQQGLVDVPADIVGTDLAGDHELFGILSLQSLDFVGGNVVDQLPGAVLEVGQHVVAVIGQEELDLVHGHVVSAMEVLVLGQGDDGVVLPAGHLVSTVGNISSGIGSPSLVGNNILTNGEVGGEGQQLVPVSNRSGQSDFQ